MLGMMETNAHLGDGKLLQQLIQEAVNDSSSIEEVNEHKRDLSSEQQLQTMIENYQQHVLKQKQHYQVNCNPYSAAPMNTPEHLKVNGSTSVDGPARIRISKANGSSSTAAPVPPPSMMSHSQPCLYVTEQKYELNGSSYFHQPHSSDPRDQHPDNVKNALSASIDLNVLRAENSFLKQQIEMLQNNTKVLRSLELSYERIEREFSQMTLHREKQEQLEQAIRFKMEQQLQRLTNENELLQRQVEKLNLIIVQQPVDPEHLVHYNRLMTDLLPQNKELLAIKERQQMEIEAQNATLEEQRNHIEMLDKALGNAQERLAAKERTAADAAALVDKCSHQQKLLQEAIDEKQKQQQDHSRQRSLLEKEVGELKMQLEETQKKGSAKETEEAAKPHKALQLKDEKITQLESSLLEMQKRHSEEMQHKETSTRTEMDALRTKIRSLEKEKLDQEGRIQDLLEDKQRIHSQWANDRRSIDQRVKILEQNLRQNDSQFNGFPNNNFYSSHQPTSTSMDSQAARIQTSPRSSVFHNQTLQQMEEIRQKIADRRGAAPASAISWMNRINKPGLQSSNHTRSASGSDFADYTIINTPVVTSSPSPASTAIVSLVSPMGHHSSASSADSTTNSSESISPVNHNNHSTNTYSSTTTVNTSANVQFSLPNRSSNNRMASKMPTSNLSSYIEKLPAATRRRFTEQNNVVKKRTAVALGSGYRRSAWNFSSNENSTTTSPHSRNYESSIEPTTCIRSSSQSSDGQLNLTTVVEVNNLDTRDEKYQKHRITQPPSKHLNTIYKDDEK